MRAPKSLMSFGNVTGSRPSAGKIALLLSVAPVRSDQENSHEIERADRMAHLILQTVSTMADTMLFWEL